MLTATSTTIQPPSPPDATTKQDRRPLGPKAPNCSVPLRADAPVFQRLKAVFQAQQPHPSSQLEFAPPALPAALAPPAAFIPPAHAFMPSPPMYTPPCFMPPGRMAAPPPPPHQGYQHPHQGYQHARPHPSPTEVVTTRWQQQLRLRDSWYDHAHEQGGPSPAMPAQSVQLRIDPSDGQAYTIETFVAYYGGTAEWQTAWPLPQLQLQLQLQRVAAPAHHLAHHHAHHHAHQDHHHARDSSRDGRRAYAHGATGPPRQPLRPT